MSETALPDERDPLVDEFVAVMMSPDFVQASGAADYDRVRAAFVAILTEFIAPQGADVCQRMQDALASELRASVRAARMPKMRLVGEE